MGLKIVGVDEVGRGCLAGPLYAGAAAIHVESFIALDPKDQKLIRDSKTLSEAQRLKVAAWLKEGLCEALGLGIASVEEIEQWGIRAATELAMMRAIAALKHGFAEPEVLLVDGSLELRPYKSSQFAIPQGDKDCPSIAAAAIWAKVQRDLFMSAQAEAYPGYGFEQHVGYGTKKHLESLKAQGPCPLHRRNFKPLSDWYA